MQIVDSKNFLFQPRRSYTRHKSGFLKRVEESESGSDDEDTSKPSKPKRKKPNVEEVRKKNEKIYLKMTLNYF